MKGRDETRQPAVRKEPKSWTLLLIGELGNPVSFRLTKPVVAVALASVAAAFALMVFSTVSYFGAAGENKTLKKELAMVKTQLIAADQVKEKALVRLMLEKRPLEGDGESGEPALKEELAAKTVESSPSSGLSRQETTGAPLEGQRPVDEGPSGTPGEPSEETPPAVSEGSVTVEKLEIRQITEGDFLEYEFIVKNTDPQGRRAKGYTFVVLRPEQGSVERPAVSPSTPLTAGMPSMYEKGQYFSISRYKPIRGTFPSAPSIEPFETATIYVYSETGSLLAERVYQIEQLSGS